MDRLTRRAVLAATGAAALAGCVGGDAGSAGESGGGAGADDATTPTPTQPCPDPRGGDASVTPVPADPPDAGASGSLPTADVQLPLPKTPTKLRDLSQSGGPPKDGIPSIDDPQFVGVDAVDFLEDADVVFGVVRNGVAKAYPQTILAQHEIVNDTLAGTPVAVTYCPLTGTAMGFYRGSTTFGVSGRLINNNLVMYDRATEAWWPQILGTAIPGPWNEDPEVRSLREFRVVWTDWASWRERHPDTRVLSTETGYARNYANDPYGSYTPPSGYYESGSPMFPAMEHDDRYDPKNVVMGTRTADGAVAFEKTALRSQGVIEGELAGAPVLGVYDPRYDTGYVYENPEGRSFSFDERCGHVVDADGTACDPAGLGLSRVYALDAMWFAWSGYYPETTVHE
jgi:hypothetical protein